MRQQEDRTGLDEALNGIRQTATDFAFRLTNDARLRARYFELTAKAAAELREAVDTGRISPAAAAAQANRLRNEIMELTRRQTSDFGRAIAQQVKASGKSLDQLMEIYAQRRYRVSFSRLYRLEQQVIFMEIVEASGRANPRWSAVAQRWGRYGRGLFALSVAISAYNILTAENILVASAREGGRLGFGLLGGAAGGAVAGLACGPGAPVCSSVGIIAGGIAGALGADLIFDTMDW